LGAIINTLKHEDWEFESGYDGHRNYVYKVKQAPVIRKIVVVDGRAIEVANQGKLI
jgi:hypothetical protein